MIHKVWDYYLAECKWEKNPVEASVVRDLYGKLSIRVDVKGLVVSMSGFTSGAVEAAKECFQERVIILFGLEDIKSLIYDRTPFEELLNAKCQQAITRKKANFR